MVKTIFFIILVAIVTLISFSCSKGPVKLEFAVIDSVYSVSGIEYSADYCKMQVLENPLDVKSKVIDIPVIRIRTKSNDPGAPVFLLNDGPGLSNFNQVMPTWLANNHDVVIVGYRGVDGSINLNLPELNQITQNPNFLSEANLELAGKALSRGFKKLQDSLEIDVNNYNILNMAYDVESARAAFQYPKINLYAAGFGARIAQIYAKLAPNYLFRILFERPKTYGCMDISPEEIESVLDFYEHPSAIINNGKSFSKTIIDGLSALPNEHNGQIFDKDRILYTAYVYMDALKGPAAVHEAFMSAGNGDYDGLAYLEEMYTVHYPQFNIGDYIIKSVTSEFDSNKDYIKDYSYSSISAFGSPISKLVYGTYQKSDFKARLLDTLLVNPKNLGGEILIVSINLDFDTPYEFAEFTLKEAFLEAQYINLMDYNLKALHSFRIAEYSELIERFIYVGSTKKFKPEPLEINLKPEKTFKQLALERIQ
ncbi:MAG: hypothetical protein KIT33_03835 [Candidatus Kapabacteria bacterium]|nr:hypothetical protein [Ignavibacteriota bacterium]MCW5884084.1 hypothetical protein [Candidatus Kapabacteria bacterium]